MQNKQLTRMGINQILRNTAKKHQAGELRTKVVPDGYFVNKLNKIIKQNKDRTVTKARGCGHISQ